MRCRCLQRLPARSPLQFEDDGAALPPTGGLFAQAAVWLVIGLISLNVISTLLECGFGACADNPTVYELLRRF